MNNKEKSFRRAQKGQAIVLLAVAFSTLCAMLALAVDAGRLYNERRNLQNAVDAAVLVGGDTYQQQGSYTTAESRALYIYRENERTYGAYSCDQALAGPPAGGTITFNCTYAGDSARKVTLSVTDGGANGATFYMYSTYNVTLGMLGILIGANTEQIAASAQAQVNNQARTPALATISQAGCGGNPGNSISIAGSSNLTIIGDLTSNGSININNAASTIIVAGNVTDQCPSPPPGQIQLYCYPSGSAPPCVAPDTLGTATAGGVNFPDPAYTPPSLTGLSSQPKPSSYVVLSPGVYTQDPALGGGAGCYFLAAGIYDWQSGYTSNGGFLSNELKPPAEPLYDSTNSRMDYNQTSTIQLWNDNGVNCAGDFTAASVPSSSGGTHPLSGGSWGIVVTTIRQDSWKGQTYWRESSPSRCRSITTNGSSQGIQVAVSNVPGAQGYNVYGLRGGCPAAGAFNNFAFAYMGSFSSTTTQQNNSTSSCPYMPSVPATQGSGSGTCSLGYAVSQVFDSTNIPGGVPLTSTGNYCSSTPTWTSPSITPCAPPDGETPPPGSNFPNDVPARNTPPAGDMQGENLCATTAGANEACPGQVTPGAVQFYLPSTGCLSIQGGGDVYTFSGYQFNWISIYEPGAQYPPANTCSNSIQGHSVTSLIGLTYVPSASISITGTSQFLAPISGGVIASTATIGGTAGITIKHNQAAAPAPPATRLIK